MEDENKNSFTIGTASTGGAIKVYFRTMEEAEKSIDWALDMYCKAKVALDKLKGRYGVK